MRYEIRKPALYFALSLSLLGISCGDENDGVLPPARVDAAPASSIDRLVPTTTPLQVTIGSCTRTPGAGDSGHCAPIPKAINQGHEAQPGEVHVPVGAGDISCPVGFTVYRSFICWPESGDTSLDDACPQGELLTTNGRCYRYSEIYPNSDE